MHRIVCAKSNSEKTREKIVRRQAMPNVGKCKVIKSWAKTSSSCPLLLLLRRRNEVNFHSLDQDARIETVLMRAKWKKISKELFFFSSSSSWHRRFALFQRISFTHLAPTMETRIFQRTWRMSAVQKSNSRQPSNFLPENMSGFTWVQCFRYVQGFHQKCLK